MQFVGAFITAVEIITLLILLILLICVAFLVLLKIGAIIKNIVIRFRKNGHDSLLKSRIPTIKHSKSTR